MLDMTSVVLRTLSLALEDVARSTPTRMVANSQVAFRPSWCARSLCILHLAHTHTSSACALVVVYAQLPLRNQIKAMSVRATRQPSRILSLTVSALCLLPCTSLAVTRNVLSLLSEKDSCTCALPARAGAIPSSSNSPSLLPAPARQTVPVSRAYRKARRASAQSCMCRV